MPALERAPARAAAGPPGWRQRAAAGRGRHPSRPQLGLLLLAWTGLSWGIAHVNGYYSGVALLLVGAGTAALLVAVLEPARAGPNRGGSAKGVDVTRVGVLAIAALLAVTPLVHLAAQQPHAGGPAYLAALLSSGGAVVLLAVLLTVAVPPRWGLPVVAALALAGDLAVVVAAPDPAIDVHTVLQQSSDGLLTGADLYRQSWTGSTGLADVYPYLPATTLLLAPFRWLLGDVRLGLVAALLVTVTLLARLARSAPRPALVLLPALVVAYPRAILVVQDSWTEPLLLALLVGCVAAVLAGHPRVAIGCLALALASKQHVALLLPVAGLWPAFGWRRTAAAAGLGLAVVAPWLLAGPGDLWHDAVTSALAYPVLTTALDLPALLARHGATVGFAVTGSALLGSYAVCARRLPRDETGFAAGCALVLLTVCVTNKQSFFNHYTLVTGLLVLAAVLTGRREAVA